MESVFHYKGFVPDHSIERVVPTGHVYILFELDGITRSTFNNETLEPNASFRSAWISGNQRHYISISAHQDSEMFVIQLKAEGGRPFLHIDMSEICDSVVPGDGILDGQVFVLRDQLKACEDPAAMFEVAESWLGDRFDENLCPSDELVGIVEALKTSPASQFSSITEGFSGTQKHLIDLFKRFVGMTPKVFQRVMRFNEILAQIQQDQFLSWGDIANACGYSDQSHFIKEFRHFSGFNPEEFIRAGHNEEEPNFFPLDRQG